MKNNIIHLLKVFLTFFVFATVTISCIRVYNEKNILTSPDSNIKVELFETSDSNIVYKVFYKDSLILKESRLGIKMKDSDFANNICIKSISKIETVNDQYSLTNGKRKTCEYKANRKIYHIENKQKEKMDIIFQVSDDGVAFRYYFPGKTDHKKEITREYTSYHFPENTRIFLQPKADSKTGWARCNPSYEENYYLDQQAGAPAPLNAGWVYPALFKYRDVWVLISETNMDGSYCGTGLHQYSPDNEYFVKFPQETENFPGGGINPVSKLPWYSPWRILTIGNLETIVESTLGTDLAEPAINVNSKIIKPGRSSWSWVLLKDDNTIYPVQKKFIDYASEMGWEYCLIDAGWDEQIGYEKIKELTDYAKEKNVGILLWYNSSGDWNDTPYTPKDLILTHESRMKEFNRIKKMGVRGVKIDFFGGDGQSVMKYYTEILKDAAKAGLLVNFHGCTLPRGWQRTYPHLMSMESVKGFEFITFDQINADVQPSHCTVIPFTRNVFDPMDFTPVCFSEVPNIERKTSNAFELASGVIFQSGIQHFAEIPEGMEKVPDYVKEILSELPVVWDDIKFIDGYPGKYVVLARKFSDTWYVAGINGEEVIKELELDLSSLAKGNATLITDGNTNRTFKKTEIKDLLKKFMIELKPQGGFLLITQE